MLSDEAIAEYQKIYKKQYGKDLTKEEAIAQGIRLLNLFKIIYKPIPKERIVKKQNVENQ